MAGPTPDILDRTARLAEELRKHIPVTAVVLFGSQLAGDTHAGSDIDVAVFTPEAERMTLRDKVDLSLRIGRLLGWDVELHFFSDSYLREKSAGDFGSYILEHGLRVA
jgi:predicted nucleotidyltransferase